MLLSECLDWKKLYFGTMSKTEVAVAVKDQDWQTVRLSMKGVSLQQKYDTLLWWLEKNEGKWKAKVQITNYVTALSRGGLIKPEDYQRPIVNGDGNYHYVPGVVR